MSDATTTTENTSTDESVTPDNPPAWARKEIDRRDKKIAELEEKVMNAAFDEAGIDRTRGLGQKIREHYKGAAEVDDIRSFAAEYEYPLDATEETTKADRVHETQDRIAEVVDNSETVEDSTVHQQIAQAEAEGNWALAAELKAAAYPHPGR